MKKSIFAILSAFILNLFTLHLVQAQDCNQIADEYLVFAQKAIAYYKRVKTNPLSTNISEYTDYDTKVRGWQDKVMNCAMKDVNVAMKIYPTMTQLAEIVVSSSSLSRSIPSTSSSSASQASQECNYCKPPDIKGWYIKDFNLANRTYTGGRYVLRPGYKKCETCFGTGDCRIKCSGGKRDCPGICDEYGTCQTCKGDRFVVCKNCRGTGRKTV